MADVFLLWHQNPNDEEGMLLGVYSSRELAEARITKAAVLPGFRRFPDDFLVDRYEVDKDQWTEGFVTMAVDGSCVDDSGDSG